ncbi:MAG: serine protease, partial [Verrucomicrobiaceae bacterium]
MRPLSFPSAMKRKFIPVALFLGMSLLDCSAEMDREEAIREIDAKIAALQKEKAKLLAESGESPSALHDENGKVSHRITNSVVIIEGDKSVGTGFVAMTEGKKYLYTAAHVFGGNSKLTIRSSAGTEFKKFGDLQAAEGADLIRLEMLDDPAHYLELAPVDSLVPLNTEIAALGNGGGNGVVAVETGKVLGTSADLLEVDAAIIQGNSGGPVVELATGKVVGEVTHLTSARKDIWSEGTRQGEVRRFACRLNKEWKWTTYKTGTFLNDSRALEEFDELTRLCFAIAQLEPGESGLRLNARLSEDTTVLSVFDKNKENDLVRSLIGMNTELSSRKMSLSDAELNKKFRSLLAQAEARASRSNQAFKPQGFAWFLRNRATFSVDARNESILALKRRL